MDLNIKSLIPRTLVVAGVVFVMFIGLLLDSNTLYVFDNQRLPSEVLYSMVWVGIPGCVLYMVNRTPFRYLVFYPPAVLAILYMVRA